MAGLSPAVWTVTVATMLAAFWPVWVWYLRRLNDGSDEPWGLLALAVTGYAVWQNRAILRPDRRAFAVGTVSLAVYALGFASLPPLIRAMLALLATGMAMGLRVLPVAVWGMLALSLPVISSAQFYAGWPLRLTTAVGTEGVLNGFGLEVVRSGAELRWRDATVGVDPPCSGIRMLWIGLFVHFLLAVRHRLTCRTLAWLTPLVITGVVGANIARASLLFFRESGRVDLPEWTHPGVGAAVFLGFVGGLARLHGALERRESPCHPGGGGGEGSMSRREAKVLVLVAVWAGLVPFFRTETIARSASADFPGWPADWEGAPLVAESLSPRESEFERNFPGRIGVFHTADTSAGASRRLICRWVTHPTRKLHSSADCFRAGGFTAEEPDRGHREDEKRFVIFHPDLGRFRVREFIFDSAEPRHRWTEVSEWFWDATFHRGTAGPWLAITIIETAPEK
ncbi:MAG: archaeosortase/exosortase family protein [Akkermansiaceae bacterium]|nr:archaeosortase/exosortase family protein [Akkermansiaceae bacterium]